MAHTVLVYTAVSVIPCIGLLIVSKLLGGLKRRVPRIVVGAVSLFFGGFASLISVLVFNRPSSDPEGAIVLLLFWIGFSISGFLAAWLWSWQALYLPPALAVPCLFIRGSGADTRTRLLMAILFVALTLVGELFGVLARKIESA